jgi:hypothetical protein
MANTWGSIMGRIWGEQGDNLGVKELNLGRIRRKL